MARKAASWFIAKGADCVNASGGTGRHFSIRSPAKVRLYIAHGRRVGVLLLVFQRPLLFGRVNQAKIIDASILLRRGAGFNEVGDGNG
jgi:hypothetical protein